MKQRNVGYWVDIRSQLSFADSCGIHSSSVLRQLPQSAAAVQVSRHSGRMSCKHGRGCATSEDWHSAAGTRFSPTRCLTAPCITAPARLAPSWACGLSWFSGYNLAGKTSCSICASTFLVWQGSSCALKFGVSRRATWANKGRLCHAVKEYRQACAPNLRKVDPSERYACWITCCAPVFQTCRVEGSFQQKCQLFSPV